MRWRRRVAAAGMVLVGTVLLVVGPSAHGAAASGVVTAVLGGTVLLTGLVATVPPTGDAHRVAADPGAVDPGSGQGSRVGDEGVTSVATRAAPGRAEERHPESAGDAAAGSAAFPVRLASLADGTPIVADAAGGIAVVGDGPVAHAVFRAVVRGLVATTRADGGAGRRSVHVVGADVDGAESPTWEAVLRDGTGAASVLDDRSRAVVATAVLIPSHVRVPAALGRVVLDDSGCRVRIDGADDDSDGPVVPVFPPP